ncbi:leucine-rich repeat neuronal protein 4 [Pseudophryne corroboree]|uniref:leucine-rich repeat neuronal protein 4 n=1 Tax=Pseudophryne corroboree TaxID=495146 RepID=UPI003081CAE9
MFRLLLLMSHMGILAALLNSTDQTVTVSKNLTEPENVTETLCRKQCNDKCLLRSHNLEVFPACLPRTVTELDLGFNNITVIRVGDVHDLSQLRVLSLSHNQISEFNWGSHVLPHLESLDLSHNQLSVIPKCIMLKNVKWLSLAGNPISHIQASAFSCFPSLISLDLSSTLIGSNSSKDIEESAFALNITEGKVDPLKSLKSLDLSGTYLTRVTEAWGKDLPNLKELHIRNMVNMERLEDELLTWFPQLELLNCNGSSALSYVRTEIFNNASRLKYLYFTNCKLTTFSSWNITSDSVIIDLHGNPLICTCDLEWLFLNHAIIFQTSANELLCKNLKGDLPNYTGRQLQEQCLLNKPKKTGNEVQDRTTSNSTIGPNVTAGTMKEAMESTPTTNKGPKSFHLESVTVFKTTSTDSNATTSSPKIGTGVVTQETSPVSQGDVSSEVIKFSIDSVGGSSSLNKHANKSTPISTVMSSTSFLSPISTIKAGSGHSIPENESSNEDEAKIPREYREEYDEEETQIKQNVSSTQLKACDYNPCRHLQVPCMELQQLEPCLCPGLSGEDTLPDPPYLDEVLEITDTSVQIRWCAPNSIVKNYQLVYQPEGGRNESVNNIYVTMRQYTLHRLAPYTTYKVCVVGTNKKGNSVLLNTSSRSPCAEFKTKPSTILIIAILSALGGLFLVIITVLSVYLYKACKNNIVNQYDTHLVSYKNPAFEYHLTIPSYH